MRFFGQGRFGQLSAVLTAALVCAAVGFGSPGVAHAQYQDGARFQKKGSPRGPAAVPRHGAGQPGAGPRAFGNRAMQRPGGGAFGARGNRPNARSANSGNGRFGNRPGQSGRNQLGRGFTNRDPRRRAVNGATAQMRQFQRTTLRRQLFTNRARMPVFPLPGERNFTGIPPVNETRFVSTEMVCQWSSDITQQRIEEIAREHNLDIVSVQRSDLTGSTRVYFRINGNRAARDVVRAMETARIVSQPNYVYETAQASAEPAAAAAKDGGSDQYVVNKLKLEEAHKIATGKGVLVAVIDSQVDDRHPEIAKGIAERFDAVGLADKPDTHGTGMAGAIVAQDRLIGVAPGARTLAIHAFATGTARSPRATTQSIIAGLEWALGKGARVINMSFAGPYDPMLALAMKKASERGAILIAAVGNAGPKSPPLYPAADPHVIGVTAIDDSDKVFQGANAGAQVALAAPGVDVMVPAPADAYQLTTGTSVAAAHVSGVVALLLEKHPKADAATILEVLTSSATRLAASGKRDDQSGWGLIDPLAALNELDARIADAQVAGATPAPAAIPQNAASSPASAAAPASAASRSALPRPGLYLPKQ